ncbi:uncharacterized protein LOC129060480 [Pongo abelii]|uniref:uncharacterized protein LOC129060480 n=1 Tax=Pongo abelii TaxID=9601 RepID=UPI0023E7C382|nr:uncharacterized protein LOC129060480 [Pongo abelii]
MALREGRAGPGAGGAVKPSWSHSLCTPSSPRAAAPEPQGLRPAARSRAARAPVLPALGPRYPSRPPPPAARRRLLFRWPGRGLPWQTCHPTPRKRAAGSRLPFVPPLGSALRRRPLSRGSRGLGPGRARFKFRPCCSFRTRAVFAWLLWCGLRAELRGSGAPSLEPAQARCGGASQVCARLRKAPEGENPASQVADSRAASLSSTGAHHPPPVTQ